MAAKDTGGQKQAPRRDDTTEEAEASTDVQERQEALTEDVDSILDEIDDVLEENSEDFVRQYIQKGGQ